MINLEKRTYSDEEYHHYNEYLLKEFPPHTTPEWRACIYYKGRKIDFYISISNDMCGKVFWMCANDENMFLTPFYYHYAEEALRDIKHQIDHYLINEHMMPLKDLAYFLKKNQPKSRLFKSKLYERF